MLSNSKQIFVRNYQYTTTLLFVTCLIIDILRVYTISFLKFSSPPHQDDDLLEVLPNEGLTLAKKSDWCRLVKRVFEVGVVSGYKV